MKYTLHIAFEEKIGEAILRVGERIKKFAQAEYPAFVPLLFEPTDEGFDVRRPEIQCKIADLAIAYIELKSGIPVSWLASNKATKLADADDITDFFEDIYLKNITTSNAFDPELHIMCYVPLYSPEYIEYVNRIVDNLPYGYKIIINVIAIPYDLGEAAGFVTFRIPREERGHIMSSTMGTLVEIRESVAKFRHIILFQNRNINGWALEFDFDKFVSTCADIAIFMIGHYHDVIKHTEPDRPILAINSQSYVLDIYYALNQWIRDLFVTDSQEHIIEETNEGERNIAEQIYNRIIDKEKAIVKEFLAEIDLKTKEYTIEELEGLFNEKCRQRILTAIETECHGLSVTIKNQLYKRFRNVDSLSTTDLEEYLDNAIEQDGVFIESLPLTDDIKDAYFALEESLKQLKTLKLQLQKDEEIIEQLKKQLSHEDYQTLDYTDGNIVLGSDIYKPIHVRNTPLTDVYKPVDGEFLPLSIDLRPYFPSIKNQGKQGSCGAFSMVSVFEYFLKCLVNKDIDLSEAFAYFNSRKEAGNTEIDEGASFNDILKAASQYGLCLEELCPYNETVFNQAPSQDSYEEAVARKITEAKSLKIDVQHIKSALAKGYPVVVSIQALEVMKQNTNGFISYTEQMQKTSSDSYHAMVICGYSDREGYFIARNSWGTMYGDNGYCYLPYSLFRQKGIIDSCYVITGISDQVLDGLQSVVGDKITLIGKTPTAQYEIVRNMIIEKHYSIQETRKLLNKYREQYAQLCKMLGERNVAEESIKDIDQQIQEIQQKRQKKRFNFLGRGEDNTEVANLRQKRNMTLLNNIVVTGLRKLNLDYLSQSEQLEKTSEILSQEVVQINNATKKDQASYFRKISPDTLNLNDFFNIAFNVDEMKSLLYNAKDIMKDVFKRKIGLYEIYSQIICALQEYMLKTLNLEIGDFLEDNKANQFFDHIEHSSVMAMIEGKVPMGFGEEAIYLTTPIDLSEKGIKFCNNISVLESQDIYRLTFLHIEKYDMEHFCIFSK